MDTYIRDLLQILIKVSYHIQATLKKYPYGKDNLDLTAWDKTTYINEPIVAVSATLVVCKIVPAYTSVGHPIHHSGVAYLRIQVLTLMVASCNQ